MIDRWKSEWIDTPEGVQSCVERAKAESYISVDTETVGWESNNERLCLIQIGYPSTKQVVVIDALSIKDYSPFQEILPTPKPLIVAHNAHFEERQFARHGVKIKGICDTLPMARHLRPDLPNHTLQTCCKLLLGITISKEEQTSDWSRRPLTASQMQYAATDAEVAIILYDHLAEMQDQLMIDPTLDVPGLMALLADTVNDKFALTREIGAQLAILNNRYEAIRETIKTKLQSGQSPYSGPYGKASITRAKRTELNPNKVREVFPDIAPLVIQEAVDRKRLQSVMKEYGIHTDRIEDVSDIIGYTDRLNLKVRDPGANAPEDEE